MPCNTAHAYIDAMRAAVEIPILDMLAETAACVDVDQVGLLATEAVVRIGLYDAALRPRGIRVVLPGAEDQADIARWIAAVKAGEPLASLRPRLACIVARLKAEGARALVVGCTEISLLTDVGSPLPAIDALDCLVSATVREARNREGGSAWTGSAR
jgi:aspartate racemase